MRALTSLALIAVLALGAAGCGQSAGLATQRQLITYQDRIGAIDGVFSRPTSNAHVAERRLARAVAEYQRLRPPPKIRAAGAQALKGLQDELLAYRRALRAVSAHNANALTAAESLGSRGRKLVNDGLRRINVYASACRANPAHC